MLIWERQLQGALNDIFGAGKALGGAAQAAGTIGAAGIEAGATISAAHTQGDAAKYAADKQYDAAHSALNLQQSIYNQQRADTQVQRDEGNTALWRLGWAKDNGFTSPYSQNFTQPTQFTQSTNYQGPSGQSNAPTASTANPDFNGNTQYTGPDGQNSANPNFGFTAADLKNDPSYQFRFQQGQAAVQAAQVAHGYSDSGAALKELTNYGQNAASQEYAGAYARAQNTFQQNYANTQSRINNNFGNAQTTFQGNYNRAAAQAQQNFQNEQSQFQQNFQNQASQTQQNYNNAYQTFTGGFDRASDQFQNNYARGQSAYQQNYNQWANDQTNSWNRLSSLAGIGQTANGQLSAAGTNYANSAASVTTNAADNAANYLTQGANASAAGVVGLANIGSNTISQLNQQAQNRQLLAALQGYGSNGYGAPYQPPSAAQWGAYNAGGTVSYVDPATQPGYGGY